jgi:hypothetical protein
MRVNANGRVRSAGEERKELHPDSEVESLLECDSNHSSNFGAIWHYANQSYRLAQNSVEITSYNSAASMGLER